MMADPKCYTCKYRREVPGSCHSSCAHPKVPDAGAMVKLLQLMGQGLPIDSGELHIEAHPHGVARGWFAWPYNFDPVWLRRCDGYEAAR